MSRHQLLTITIFVLIFAVLYFGCDKKSNEQKALEKSRAQNIELINIDRVRQEAEDMASPSVTVKVDQLKQQLENASLEEDKADYLKELASIWYRQGELLLSAWYAERVATLENTEETWSIAGTSYAIAAQNEVDPRRKEHAAKKSRMALENALSINPDNTDNRINLALSYVEVPMEGNPMKGILMLLELNEQYPENTAVMLQLARLSLQTNQLEKAEARLLRALEINPELKQAHCMLYDVYSRKGDEEKAAREQQLCELK